MKVRNPSCMQYHGRPLMEYMPWQGKLWSFLQFASVWGAAHATAIKWYRDGCRTLDDVRARTDLTQQQVDA